MMKRLRKPAALLLALVMALTLAACGGKGASKTNPAVGKYIGETVLSFDEWVPMDEVYDLGDNYIELKEDGTGCFMLDGDPTTIDWKLDKDGALTLDRDGAICNCTLKDGLITVNDYFGFDLQLTFRKSGGSTGGNTGADEMSLDDFAEVYGGDWHGMAGLTDATGAFEELNDTAHEILARLVFDGDGDCQVWLAMYLEGENDFNLSTRMHASCRMTTPVWSCGVRSWAARCRTASCPWTRPAHCMSAARWIPTWWTALSACWPTCGIWTTRTGQTRTTSPCRRAPWSSIAA